MSIFRAYDIRGIVGETLTREKVFQIGRAIGSEAETRGCRQIVVARDGRLSGPELMRALIEGLRETGREVIDIGMVPTPVLYFAAYHFGTGSGVMLTGSHNPAEYNGLKIMLDHETLSGEAIAALGRRIERGELLGGEQGSLREEDVREAYLARIIGDARLAPRKKKLKVVVDCGNGVAGELAPRLLRELGCEVVPLYCEIDGHFPHHHPDPTRPENLTDLIAAAHEHQADLGLGFDGDGDRLGVVDSQGTIIWADRQMMLYACDILRRHPGATIVYDVKCSRHLGDTIARHGGQPIMWKTGHSLMKAKLFESGALLAGEMSGHIFFKDRWYGFDDALYTAARLLEILSRDKRPTYQVFKELPDALSTPELHVRMDEGEHFAFMERFLARAEFEDASISRIDGLRADFSDGWGLVRPSNTTPVLVLRFEADNEDALIYIQEKFRQQMLEIDPELELPF